MPGRLLLREGAVLWRVKVTVLLLTVSQNLRLRDFM